MATHNRGGEITYLHIGGNTYQFTITTCTKSSAPADRPELFIDWGDGTTQDTVPRTQIINSPGFDAQKNLYIINHTFAGSGTFTITVEDPNRNGGIVNIGNGNSDQQTFCIASEIVISPFLGINNSVQFDDCPCPAEACAGSKYCYNSQAYDPDGDSLSFELVPPLGVGCNAMIIPLTYQYPDDFGGVLSIDPVTGTLCWDAPSIVGEFNVAIVVTEWRNGIKVGSVLRDMQITVFGTCNNDPPEIIKPNDTCIIAGDELSFTVYATDPNTGDVITLEASGAPFQLPSNNATYTSNQATSPDSASATFNWQTTCDHIRSTPYELYFTATDDAIPVQLSDFDRVNVTVKAPAPTGLTATPATGIVNLLWNSSPCTNATGYRIYRKKGTTAIGNDCCNQSSAEDLGYELIGETNDVLDTMFTDTSQLAIGEEYCYVITAVFPIDVESCLSNEACTILIKDVPVITHVSVNSTDISTGSDSIMWSKPTELDTLVAFPPPYFYRVFQGNGTSNPTNLVYTSPLFSQLSLSDTIFVHQSINTETQANTYRVQMLNVVGSDTNVIGNTNNATSIFLSLQPNDNEISLSWQESVPWTNNLYYIYKGTAIGGVFTLIDSTVNLTYTDTGLTNGQTYCYKIRSRGTYTDPSIITPLLNWSQEACAAPIDLTPPCPPVLSIDDSCGSELNLLSWTNPNNTCADDVTRYNIYYSETPDGSFSLLTEISSSTDTSYLDALNLNKTGCYYVTALDSIIYNNESLPSNVVCIDNCPIYFLPNVFSPNGDGLNDFFIPIAPYRYVDSIDLTIYNRWGNVIFTSNDPAINWDGTVNGQVISEGVYYYICKVYTIRLEGVEETELKGAIQVFTN